MRYLIVVLSMILGLVTSAAAQLSIGIGLPGVSIGFNVPLFPQLVRVPGYPVYYAPQLQSNFFFYDGMYWIYQGDNWYASSWYNGPWDLVGPEDVPLFVLRVPVRYYRSPPAYFRGWQADAPPRWGEHWGNAWQQRRSGWDQWNRSSAPPPAPLPTYQRRYSADRYPQAQQQQALRSQNYRYVPRDAIVRQHFEQPAPQKSPVPAQREPQKSPALPQREPQTAAPAKRPEPPRTAVEPVRRPEPIQTAPQPKAPAVPEQRKQPLPVVPSHQPERPIAGQVTPQPRAPAAAEGKKQPQPVSREQRPAPMAVAPQARTPAAQEQRKPAPAAAAREQPPAAPNRNAAPDKGARPQQKQEQGQRKGPENGDAPAQERKN